MSKTHALILYCLSALLMLPTGCTKQPSGRVVSNEGVAIPFALSVGQGAALGTKMSGSITQAANNSFRGIEYLYVVPFCAAINPQTPDQIEVSANDVRWGHNPGLPQDGLPSDGLIGYSNAFLFSRVHFELRTNALLIYGKAPDETGATDEVECKQRNGILNHPDLNEVETPEDISFSLEPATQESNLNNWKSTNFLKSITAVSWKSKNNKVSCSFNDPASYNNHPTMKAAFEAFTNNGVYFPLSSEVLNYKLTQLYKTIYPLTNPDNAAHVGYNQDGYKYVYELALKIINAIGPKPGDSSEDTDYIHREGKGTKAQISIKVQKEVKDAPACYGLPAGTIPAQWKEGTKSFALLKNINEGWDSQNNTLNHIAGLAMIPEDDICYPPALWYYANSPLCASDNAYASNAYASSSNWDNIIANHYPKSAIDSDTKAAAAHDPLQYGVARLQLTCLRCTTSTLPQSIGSNVKVSNTDFPLTGIIISDQYDQDFSFQPKDNAKMRYIYDADVSGAYLTSTQDSPAISSLVLQTRANTNVHFALEFLNTSKNIIHGLGGCNIYPNCHFYLAGILDLNEAQPNNSSETLESVFVRDHVTSVTVSIKSLVSALDIVPDLTDPQLQLGVKAEFGWHLSTPVYKEVVIH